MFALLKRFISNRTTRYARQKINNGQYHDALSFLEKNEAKIRTDIFDICLGDVHYGLDNFREAKTFYQSAFDAIDAQYSGCTALQLVENRRYLTAYTDFREQSLDAEASGKHFEHWKAIGDAISTIPASTYLKKHFHINLSD